MGGGGVGNQRDAAGLSQLQAPAIGRGEMGMARGSSPAGVGTRPRLLRVRRRARLGRALPGGRRVPFRVGFHRSSRGCGPEARLEGRRGRARFAPRLEMRLIGQVDPRPSVAGTLGSKLRFRCGRSASNSSSEARRLICGPVNGSKLLEKSRMKTFKSMIAPACVDLLDLDMIQLCSMTAACIKQFLAF
jgi:hypothetical protein